MIKTIPFDGTTIRFSDSGDGRVIVLLHGYLESLEIWNGFAAELAHSFRVISIDLPGHGFSGITGEVHSMEKLAEAVIAVLDHCEIEKCFVTGHSMGGYCSLAILEKYPERLNGLCLFHSHPFPDTKQVIQNRCREIVLVNNGKKELISRINIPKAFSSENAETMNNEVERATLIAIATPDDGIKACLKGMMERPNREKVLREASIPVLLIAGKHDNYISYEDVARKIRLPERSEFVTLERSGHIGFLEEPEESLTSVSGFIERYF